MPATFSCALGIGVALNTIDNQVDAHISDITDVDVDGGVSVSAMSDSGITTNSWAAAIAWQPEAAPLSL